MIGIAAGEKTFWFNADSIAAITVGEKQIANGNGEFMGTDGEVVASPTGWSSDHQTKRG